MDGSLMTAPATEAAAANRRTQAKARTRAAILQAARRLFDDQPYDRVTMRSLAREIGMSTGALFNSFDSKGDVWRAAMLTEPPIDTPDRRRRERRRGRVLELMAGRDMWTERTGEDFTVLAAWALDGRAQGQYADTVRAYLRGYWAAAQEEGGWEGDPAAQAAEEFAELQEPAA